MTVTANSNTLRPACGVRYLARILSQAFSSELSGAAQIGFVFIVAGRLSAEQPRGRSVRSADKSSPPRSVHRPGLFLALEPYIAHIASSGSADWLLRWHPCWRVPACWQTKGNFVVVSSRNYSSHHKACSVNVVISGRFERCVKAQSPSGSPPRRGIVARLIPTAPFGRLILAWCLKPQVNWLRAAHRKADARKR